MIHLSSQGNMQSVAKSLYEQQKRKLSKVDVFNKGFGKYLIKAVTELGVHDHTLGRFTNDELGISKRPAGSANGMLLIDVTISIDDRRYAFDLKGTTMLDEAISQISSWFGLTSGNFSFDIHKSTGGMIIIDNDQEWGECKTVRVTSSTTQGLKLQTFGKQS